MNRICHLLELVLRGFFTPVRHKVLLRSWEVVREELLSIDALPKNVFSTKQHWTRIETELHMPYFQ